MEQQFRSESMSLSGDQVAVPLIAQAGEISKKDPISNRKKVIENACSGVGGRFPSSNFKRIIEKLAALKFPFLAFYQLSLFSKQPIK